MPGNRKQRGVHIRRYQLGDKNAAYRAALKPKQALRLYYIKGKQIEKERRRIFSRGQFAAGLGFPGKAYKSDVLPVK